MRAVGRDLENRNRAKWSLLALLAVSGCTMNPSLLNIGERDVDRIESMLKRETDRAVQEAPEPFVQVDGPPAEHLIDWWDVTALGAFILLNIADRRWFHTRQARKNGHG